MPIRSGFNTAAVSLDRRVRTSAAVGGERETGVVGGGHLVSEQAGGGRAGGFQHVTQDSRVTEVMIKAYEMMILSRNSSSKKSNQIAR